jgi:hypothetical protein
VGEVVRGRCCLLVAEEELRQGGTAGRGEAGPRRRRPPHAGACAHPRHHLPRLPHGDGPCAERYRCRLEGGRRRSSSRQIDRPHRPSSARRTRASRRIRSLQQRGARNRGEMAAAGREDPRTTTVAWGAERSCRSGGGRGLSHALADGSSFPCRLPPSPGGHHVDLAGRRRGSWPAGVSAEQQRHPFCSTSLLPLRGMK